MRKWCVLLVGSLLSAAVWADPISFVLPQSSNLKWENAASLPPGAMVAVLVGNPKQPGFYVARLKMPANFIVPPHTHISTEYNTVISGMYCFGQREGASKITTTCLSEGGFAMVPAGVLHYGFTKGETVLEISGIGPWGTLMQK